jgi:hypothetical protein
MATRQSPLSFVKCQDAVSMKKGYYAIFPQTAHAIVENGKLFFVHKPKPQK